MRRNHSLSFDRNFDYIERFRDKTNKNDNESLGHLTTHDIEHSKSE